MYPSLQILIENSRDHRYWDDPWTKGWGRCSLIFILIIVTSVWCSKRCFIWRQIKHPVVISSLIINVWKWGSEETPLFYSSSSSSSSSSSFFCWNDENLFQYFLYDYTVLHIRKGEKNTNDDDGMKREGWWWWWWGRRSYELWSYRSKMSAKIELLYILYIILVYSIQSPYTKLLFCMIPLFLVLLYFVHDAILS